MALTLNTSPAAISNSGAFNITTSLSEDATHVNLRVRCDITSSAVIVAVVEKPKGIADFDFSDILRSLIAGISFARASGNKVVVAGGSPLVAYTVLFTEVWEDAAGVTQAGDTENASAATFRFINSSLTPAAFAEYVLHDDVSRFANLTLRNNVTKWYKSAPPEYWIVFFTSVVHCELFYSQDGGAWDHATHFDPVDGWGVVIVHNDVLMLNVVTSLRIQIGELGGAKISEIMTIYPETKQIDERVVLEYDGTTGGKEYLAFEGIKDIRYSTQRDYFTGASKNKKPLLFSGVNRQLLETRFPDINNASYLKSLLIDGNVKKLLPSYATAKDVTVLTDSVKIENNELFTNQIEIEYED